jgi:hypothetical protein
MGRTAMAEAKKHDVERVVQDLGADWGKALQDQIVQAGTAQASAQLKGGKYNPTDNHIEVTVPVWVKLRFPVIGDRLRMGAGGEPEHQVQCACTYTMYSEGGGVCICKGPGAGDCDCPGVA